MSSGHYAAELGLSSAFLNQLRALAMQNRRMLPGPGAGRRRSPRSGSSVELMDYRPYVLGDDLRRLDWNVYARLTSLVMRIYRAEENLLVRICLDVSRSMSVGAPPKFGLARQIAGALAYTALIGYDRVETAACGGATVKVQPAASGEVGAARIWHFLAELEPAGTGDLQRQMVEAASRLREPGLTVVISDGLYESGLLPALRQLRALKHEIAVVQILDREEIEPTLEGDWRLTDIESPLRQVDTTLTPVTTQDYMARLAAYTEELRNFCRGQGAPFYQITSEVTIEDAIFGMMRGTLIT